MKKPVLRKKRIFASNDGVALMMVIWLITLLMTMVLAFSLMMRANAYSAHATAEAVRTRYVAQAGLERAITELCYRKINDGAEVSDRETERWRTDGRPYGDRIGDDSYIVKIADETGKIEINALTDRTGVILTNLLVNLGVSLEDAYTIVDSILDWKEAGELVRLHGAKSDYYMSLPVPYKSKNGPFDTLEELLLVKGMTREILFGNSKTPGLINFVTIFSGDDRINLNAAPREVLVSIPGIAPEIADEVIACRDSREIRSAQEAEALLKNSYVVAAPYIRLEGSNLFSVESEAIGRDGMTPAFTARAVIAVEGPASWHYLYYKSPA